MIMAKPSGTSTLKNLDFSDDWSSHPAIEWIMHHKQIFIGIFLGLLVLLIGASRFAAMRTLSAENDFFEAQTAFTQFQKESISSQNGAALSQFEQLEAILKRHPEIQPKYEGPLAQTFLITGNIPQAQQLADNIFKRTQPDYLQLYRDFSGTSLLIGAGKYEEALTQAMQLKASLDKLTTNENPILYITNLVRLAMLYQQTGQAKEELKTWEELEAQSTRSEALHATTGVLKIGQASLNQYIEQRKKALNE